MKQNKYPCLWFDGDAKQAAELYCSAFADSKITSENPMVVSFNIGGSKLIGLNGGPIFKPNPSISFYVVCESEKEIDNAWEKLSDGGQVLMELNKYPWSEKYGWIQDKYGVSWQIALDKMENVGQKCSPLLMYIGKMAGKADEAINFYTSLFDNSEIRGIMRYEKGEPDTEGFIKHAQFKIDGYVMMAMDSSLPHQFSFDEGISIVVECDTQEEIDYYWDKFTAEGEESMCGWLKDKYGVSWQIIPSILSKLMNDPESAQRITPVFMQMKKFDIQKLLEA